MAMTYDDQMTFYKALVKVMYNDLLTNASTIVTDADTAIALAEGEFGGAAASQIMAYRSQLSNSVLGAGRQAAVAILSNLAIAIGYDGSVETDDFWEYLRRYQNDNTKTVETRALTYGAASAVSGTGDGTIYRLTTDVHGDPIENVHLDTIYATCVSDQTTGQALGREQFELYQGAVSPDILEDAGSGERVTLQALAGDELLQNASFYDFTGTAASPTAIGGWTSSVTVNSTNYEFDDTNYFRTSPEEDGAGTSYALNVKVTATLSQQIRNIQQLDPATPYMMLVRYNRQVGSASGTLRIRFGATTDTVAVSAQTGWNTLALTIDEGLWLENANEDNLDVTVEWTRTSGELLIDDVVFGPMTQFDGQWFAAVGGATNFLLEKRFTMATTQSSFGGKIQYLTFLWFDQWHQSTAAGTPPSTTDP